MFVEACELGAQSGAVEDVVAEHQGGGVGADVVGSEDEGLGETVRLVLDLVGQVDAELGAVAEQALELRRRPAVW